MSLFETKMPFEIKLTDIIFWKKKCWRVTEIRFDIKNLIYSFYLEHPFYIDSYKEILLVKITDEIKYMPIEEIRCNKVN